MLLCNDGVKLPGAPTVLDDGKFYVLSVWRINIWALLEIQILQKSNQS